MKANFVASGISSVVGVYAASAIGGMALSAAGVTTLTGVSALLTLGIPFAGGVAGIMLADKFWGKVEEKRSTLNYPATIVMSYLGCAAVGTTLGIGGLFAGAAVGSFALTVAGLTAGGVVGSCLGAAMGAAAANWLTAKKIPPKAAQPAAGAAPAPA